MTVKKAKRPSSKLEDLKKKLDKVKGNIQISKRKTWFSDALENLDKKEQ